MTAYDDYILQNFPDKDGKLETNKPKECRVQWHLNGYPTFDELEEITGTKARTIRTYSWKYNWKGIRQKAESIKAQVALEEQKQKQDETLKELDQVNILRFNVLNDQLDELNKKLESPSLSEDEKKEIRQEIRQVVKDMHLVQNDRLRTVNLPDRINDKQDHKHSGEIGLNHRMKKFLDPENITKAGL